MNTDIHLHIAQWLSAHPPIAHAGISRAREMQADKACLLPFLPESGEVLVLRPVATKPELGPPPYQLCKGTRMFKLDKEWQDIRGPVPANASLEPLAATALREAVEELGLPPEHLVQLYELGPFSFSSATTGKEKSLWLFAASMRDRAGLLPPSAVAGITASRKWVSVHEFIAEGRPDHAAIVTHARGMVQGMLGASVAN